MHPAKIFTIRLAITVGCMLGVAVADSAALAYVCGNEVVEAGEQCDDGNTASGDCCSSTCTFEASGSACPDDGSVCSTDRCDGTGTCVHAPANSGVVCRESGRVSSTGPSLLPAGAQGFPAGIDESWFATHSCGDATTLVFYPTTSGQCVGFHTFELSPASAARLKSVTQGLTSGTFTSPATTANVTYFQYVGGVIDSVVADLKTLFDSRKNANGQWSVLLPVYAASGCVNPNSARLVVGFATVRLTKVQGNPGGSIQGVVDCNVIGIGEDGGPDFGTLVRVDQECDPAEVCNGVSATCPSDVRASAGTPCDADDQVCTADVCDGAGTCTHAAGNAGTPCRASAGVCDPLESCDGASVTCPADTKSTAVCRAAAGVCDAAESCDGTSDSCPADAKLTAVCRAFSGPCDAGAESCDGISDDCPADLLLNAGTVCRVATGVCDVAESCTGTSGACPSDGFAAASAVCRGSGGVCDQAETCTGSSATCPADAFLASTASCRPAVGVCDVAESCTGSGAACPADQVASGVPCRASIGECDVAESCDGAAKACPFDAAVPPGVPCTPDSEECTDDQCDGAGACVHPPIPLASVCNWAVVGGSDTETGRVKTQPESQIGGGVCADRASIGESSALTATGSWALLDPDGTAASVRLNASILDGSLVTGGGCVKGYGGLAILGTVPGPICCEDGDVELPGGDPGHVIHACGLHPLLERCAEAKAQVPVDVALLDALSSTADLGAVTLVKGETSTLAANAGLNVFDIERLRMKRNATLTLDAQGQADVVVILRVASGFSTKHLSSVVLAGGLQPEDVLIYAADGGCSIGLGNLGAGTLFCPQGPVRIREATQWTGAIAGGSSIDIGWNVNITHVPFFGLAQ